MTKMQAYLSFCVFLIIFKLCGVVSWPWLLILAPIWGPALVLPALAMLATVLFAIYLMLI